MANDEKEKGETRLTAKTLSMALQRLETAVMCEFWKRVMVRFEKCSSTLQSQSINLLFAVKLLKSLQDFLKEIKSQFEDIEDKARKIMGDISQDYMFDCTRRRRKNPRFTDIDLESETIHSDISGYEKFKIETFDYIITRLLDSLKVRSLAYEQLAKDFAFLNSIQENDVFQLKIDAASIIKKFPSDLEENCEDEFVNFLEFITYSLDSEEKRKPNSLINYIFKNTLVESTFPNVVVAIRIFLTLPVTVCEAERSFSKLKLIKNRLRSTMGQDRLNSLSVLSIENTITQDLNFDDVIFSFAEQKLRKRQL